MNRQVAHALRDATTGGHANGGPNRKPIDPIYAGMPWFDINRNVASLAHLPYNTRSPSAKIRIPQYFDLCGSLICPNPVADIGESDASVVPRVGLGVE